MDSVNAARDNTVPSDAADAGLTGWREEVHGFLERTLQEIQQAVDELQSKPRESTPPRPTAVSPPRPTAASSTHMTPKRPTAASREEVDDQMDASQTRLENLKRRLSEKLRTQQGDEPGEHQRPPQDSQS